MTARALMILGTASHVGKSILTAALGRILSDQGFRVAPFKAQNMSLNSAATPDGLEIGRAQALQAEACRVVARAEMNPVLIKPSSDTGSQIVVMGRVWGQVTAADYHQKRVEELFPIVVASYRKLAAEYDVVLLEGAGSPAEINLKARDIVNLRMAQAADADCLLVGDIDRGGVFASLVGTLELLDSAERTRIRGFLVNKFRGDIGLLQPGIEMIEQRLQRPCLGVVPFLHDLGLEEEDGVAVEDHRTCQRYWKGHRRCDSDSAQRRLCIGVIALPHLANFTDFDSLARESSVALAYLQRPEDIEDADLVILPGTKQVLDDLGWLRRSGFVSELQRCRRLPIVGVCGGLQMLGRHIDDPQGLECGGQPGQDRGLGLLPITTVLRPEKVTRRVQGTLQSAKLSGVTLEVKDFAGYEIHLGETHYEPGSECLAMLRREGDTAWVADGAIDAEGRVWGTYVHGIFDRDEFRHSFLQAARRHAGLEPARDLAAVSVTREQRLNRLAGHVRESVDVDRIVGWLEQRSHTEMAQGVTSD